MSLYFLIASIVCFILATIGIVEFPHLNVGWLGLALFAASFLPRRP